MAVPAPLSTPQQAEISVTLVDFTDQWLHHRCTVSFHDGCTYSELARKVTIALREGKIKLWAWPQVVNFYAYDGNDATVLAQIKRSNVFKFGKRALTKATRVIALVISTRRGSEFPTCESLQSFSPALDRQLRTFCDERRLRNWTLPSPIPLGYSKHSRMFVREAYEALAGEVEKLIANNRRAIVVTGTPGIGKTLFLWYLVREYSSKAPLVLDCKEVFLLVHPNGSMIRGERGSSFCHYLQDKNTMYLCDAAPDRGPLIAIAATTIVTKSPDQLVIHEFVKAKQPKVLYMPLWSLEELEQCRAECFKSSTSADALKVLSAYFGGTARETFIPDEDLPKKLADFKYGLNSLTDEAIQINLELTELAGVVDTKQKDVCHRFLHLEPVKSKEGIICYDRVKLVTASAIVCCELHKRDGLAEKKKVRRLVVASEGEPVLAVLRGVFVEPIGHARLRAGGDFIVMKLDGRGRKTTLTLPVTGGHIVFDDIVEVNGFKYVVPRARNFAAIDGAMKPNLLFQITVSGRHPINHRKLKAFLVEFLDIKEPIEQDEPRRKKQCTETPANPTILN